MASFPSTARATFKGAYTVEKIFGVLTSLLQARKIMAGGYDPLKTEVIEGQGYTILNASQAAETFGYGSQLHRMAIYHFKGAGYSIPTVMIPLPAASGGAAATKTITFADNATGSGSYVFRVGSYLLDDLITIGVSSGDTPEEVATLLNTAINDNSSLPFTATVTAGVVTITAKTADITSNSLSVTVNQTITESANAPTGMTAIIAGDVEGAGKSVTTALWNYIAAESSAWFTSIITPYSDEAELDLASNAIGQPNDQSGQYDPRDYRPGTVYTCDTTGGNAGLVSAVLLAEGRKSDCANVRLEAPDYPELGFEIACYVSGVIEQGSMNRSSSAYTRLALPELYGPLSSTNDWTTYSADGKSYDNRDTAVKGGLTPIIYGTDGIARPGDVTGFWRPEDNQNAPFKFQVNRWKSWCMQNAFNIYLNGDDNKDRAIVNSVAAVKQSERAIDADTIAAGLAQIAGVGEKYGWLYESDFTIRNTTVTISDSNPDRFDIVIPIVLSGNNRINLAEIQIDRDSSVVDLTLTA